MASTTPTITIAVFNSSDDTVEMLKCLLEQRHYRVITGHADDVKRGRMDIVAFMAEHEPNVVLWDIAPPYEQNWNFLKLLLTSGPLQGRGCVITTTHKQHLDRAAGHDTGAIEIIGKPYDLEFIVNAVSRAAGAAPPRLMEVVTRHESS